MHCIRRCLQIADSFEVRHCSHHQVLEITKVTCEVKRPE